MDLLEIKDKKGLCRDMESFAIVNTNEEAYKLFLEKKRKSLEKKEQIEQLDIRITNLDTRLTDLNRTLDKILQVLEANDSSK